MTLHGWVNKLENGEASWYNTEKNAFLPIEKISPLATEPGQTPPLIETMSHSRWNNDELHLRLKVVPRSSKDAIAGLLGDRLKVTVTAPPVDGKANAHLVRWFAKLCGVPKSNVEVVAGETSRNKTIAIRDPQVVQPEFRVTQPKPP